MEATASLPSAPSIFEIHEDDADVILNTSDDCKLFVHKLILRKASAVFATMFDLPQPAPSHNTSTSFLDMCDLPVVPVSEDKAVWDVILCMLYRHETPSFASIVDLKVVLEAAQKYDLEFITQRIEHALLCPLRAPWDPLDVYALACLYNLESVAVHAARATLALPLEQLCAHELHAVPAAAFQRLLAYRLRARDAAAGVAGLSRVSMATGAAWPGGKLFKRIEWLPRATYTFFACDCGAGGVECAVKLGSDVHMLSGRGYWRAYLERAEAALKEQPVGSVVREPALMVPAFKAAGDCYHCRHHIYEDLSEFVDCMAKEVDKAVAAVPLKF
ncbi:hypothetical protein PsYK624_149340 [Phanerochaete sordida]|uniref:BTB domain-containing protein n=1 Tax=Phanerochaete sordida TaxID=48140 RepID=A0A9P3GQW5_9APHY|nr:hypothetical protein PsYK624_149340 [Phanerochaete sordida]